MTKTFPLILHTGLVLYTDYEYVENDKITITKLKIRITLCKFLIVKLPTTDMEYIMDLVYINNEHILLNIYY